MKRHLWVGLAATATLVLSGSYAPAASTRVSRSSADPVIVAAGDIACDPGYAAFNNGNGTATECRATYTAPLLAGATAVLSLGDTQYEDGAYAKYAQSYGLSWGAYKAITHPAVGNHEYLSDSSASGYFQYFAAAAGTAGRGWYSYDIGSWHLIALNSECSFVGGCAAGSVQEQWLRADLAGTARTCILAYWHEPRFSSGAVHGSNAAFDTFWRDLYAARADVVLVAHDHEYERFGLQNAAAQADALGIREFVVGTGGRSLYRFGTPIANSEVRNASTFGVLRLTLHSTSYNWQFVSESGGTVVDSGSTSCHRSPTAATLVSFTAIRADGGALVRWRTGSEARLLGFNLYRQARRLVRLNRHLIAARGRLDEHVYSWRDAGRVGRFSYRLQAVEDSGRRYWLARSAAARTTTTRP